MSIRNKFFRRFPTDAARLRGWIIVLMLILLCIELFFVVLRGQWFNMALILTIMAATIGPVVFAEKIPVKIPPEFHFLAVLFVFAALFLGEIRRYYELIWWWDIALHGFSGLLLGIWGFLLIYVLNENKFVDIYMQPRFVALFAFLFAVASGAIWEIFEFSMDELFGTQMQKPMLGDDSGLTDTMWDLIVDTIGAALISWAGWWQMKRPEHSFFDIWIQKFIHRNPDLFNHDE